MIYIDVKDVLEKQNVRKVIKEFDLQKKSYEPSEIDSIEDINNKLKKCNMVICDDDIDKINKYYDMKKKVVIFISKRRKKNKLKEDSIYLKKNVYVYSRKNELREIINLQKVLFNKIRITKFAAAAIVTLVLLYSGVDMLMSMKISAPKIKNEKLLAETKEIYTESVKHTILKQENIVFLGDSITDYYPLDSFYKKLPVINSGIEGQTTTDLLKDIKNRVYIYNPTKVVLLAGINDMNKEATDDQILNNIKTICKDIKENRPNTEIYVESIYPVDKDRKTTLIDQVSNDRIRNINTSIKRICEENDYTFIDLFDDLNNKEEDKLEYEYSVDGLHISTEGYKIVTKKIKEATNM